MSFFHLRTCYDRHHSTSGKLFGETLYFRTFKKIHDTYRKRCACCYLKFIEESCFGHPHQGYVTEDDETWVCTACAPHYAKGLNLRKRVRRTPSTKR